MLFKVFNEIFERVNNLRIGFIVLKNIDNSSYDDRLKEMLDEAAQLVHFDFSKENGDNNHKATLISAWQALYYDLGSTIQEKKTKLGSLLQEVLKGKTLKKTTLVNDMCRYLSLKYMVPVAAYDLDQIHGDIFLGYASGEEKFNDQFFVDENEIIYFDADGALSRSWNLEDAEHVKITKETKNVIFMIDALAVVSKTTLNDMISELKNLNELFLKGSLQSFVIDQKKNKVEF